MNYQVEIISEALHREHGINLPEGRRIAEETLRYIYLQKRLPHLTPTPIEKIGYEIYKKLEQQLQQ